MARVKKVINDPDRLIDEAIEGMVLAAGGRLVSLPGASTMMRPEIADGKVALLIGGGSGHEPMYSGFVGQGLADAAVCGNIFASPTPDLILEATRAIHRGRGVLYVYGNYAGDNMNFDIAAEMAADEGIEVRTVRVMDDVAAMPVEQMQERRGIGGAFFQVKIAGAICGEASDLAEAEAVVRAAQGEIRSIGVALSAGSLPQNGEPTFALPEDEIEIGMGVHGEPGVERRGMMAADPMVDLMLGKVLPDLPFGRGERVALLLNGLGSTTAMELMIANRRVRQRLDEEGIEVASTFVGPIFTCQEMAGFSISLMRLDPERERLLGKPGWSLGYRF